MSTRLWFGLAGSALGFLVTARWAQRRSAYRALAREDARFHRAYDAVRQDAAQHTPALVFYEGRFIFSDGAERAEYPASAPASQLLKAAAHAPLGVFALLLPVIDAELPLWLTPRLCGSQSTIARAEQELADGGERAGLSEDACTDSMEVLRTTREFITQTLTRQRVAAAHLTELARTLGPRLTRLTEYATELELSAVHAATEAALQDMTPLQRDSFQVVVAGAHQARDRSLPLQYFQARFGEQPGEERRVAYAESVSGPDEARALIGTRKLDREIAAAFFGNPERLQRDVLGDAAEHLLKRRTFSRILAPASGADKTASQLRSRPSHASSHEIPKL